MKIELVDAHDIGVAVRAARKARRWRQDAAAEQIGVSESFLGKVEKGAASVHWGKLFQVLKGMGISVSVELPGDAAGRFASEEEKRQVRVERADARKASKPPSEY